MYTLPKLDFKYDSLEPYIDKKTMMLHHTKHHQTYIDNLNNYMKKNSIKFIDIENLQDLIKPSEFVLRNNGGGHYNHSFFWKCLTPIKYKQNIKKYDILNEILKNWNTLDLFYEEFIEKALSVFGSGWVWLIKQNNSLKLITTSNQDNPLMKKIKDIEHGKPILCLDVWEHAYYLKYKNERVKYIKAFLNIINWKFVDSNYKN